MSRAVDRGAFAALIEHAAAFSSRDNAKYAKNLSLPFVHLWPNGDLLRYDTDAEVDLVAHYERAGLDAANFGHTELDEVELILDWKDLKAFHTKFTRYSPRGDRLSQSEAVWVIVRSGDGWKMKLRIGAASITSR